MYLKQIEIQGFKSFAKKTVLEFDRGIISVVGPNGSGKSNFSDAIRWVLGEQSMKAVRSKKSEDVIFAGSDTRARLGMAEVSISFDNEDRKLSIDFSEVAIMRRLFRDGESEYLINGRQVRLMDIVELLAKSGYGNYSYHVISQGTIDQLVIAGPTAIKNLIEEASGVKPYYLKRDRSLRKLERCTTDLRRVSDLLNEIEPRLKSLRRQAKRMEQREQLASELAVAQREFFAVRYHELKDELAGRTKSTEDYNAAIRSLAAEITTLSGSIEALERQAAKKSSEYLRLQQELRQTETKKNRIQEEMAIIRGQLKAKAPAGSVDQPALQLRVREVESKIATIQIQVQQLQHQIVLNEKNLEQHRGIAQRLAADTATITKSLETAQHPFDLGRLKADIDKLYSRYQSLLYSIRNIQSDDDLRLLQQDASNLEILLVKLKDRFNQFSNVQMDHSELLHLNVQLQKVFTQKEKVGQEVATIEGTIRSQRAQREFFSQQMEELVAEARRLQAEMKHSAAGSRDDVWEELGKEEKKLQQQLQGYFSDIQKLEADLKSFIVSESVEKKTLLEQERQLRFKQDELARARSNQGSVAVEQARLEATLESLIAEMRSAVGYNHSEKIKQQPAPRNVAPGLEQQIAKLKTQLELVGGVDELTLQEYRETEERYTHLSSQSQDLQKAIDDLRAVIAELDSVIKKQFSNGFEKINDHFGQYFRILFGGGRASMSLVKERPLAEVAEPDGGVDTNQEEDMSEASVSERDSDRVRGKEEIVGIDIKATPPGKKLALLSALSGGERTMTAIALLMAILTSFPSPFVVLDEVDAALDEANSIRFAKILSKLAHQTQFITITHNRETMRNSSALYGITMGEDGISKVLSIKLDRAIEIAA